MGKKVRRLYRQFQPEHYDLQLDIDPEKMTFTGSVVIAGKMVGRPSQRITLHQKDLKISEAYIRRTDKKGEKIYNVSRINSQKSYDEVRLHTSEMLYPGGYNLMVNFEGKITRNMEGIYPCFFKRDGKEQKLIATQFESHHAREAFPCIDEPEAKATFDLVLKTPETKTVLANTPVKQQMTEEGRTATVFETTPRMSTYLLAFAFGDMDYREAATKDGVVVRTYATPDNVEHTEFALDCAVKTLEFYNEYFDTPYPLAKCDFIALPDFASGAMENWGCITFREQALLVDPKNTSLPMKQYVANVVAHELTHQWFGNLVTMRWWNDLWLNESFASWMSYLAVDHLFPEWEVWTQFVVDEQQMALKPDALENTHPIEVAINHPDEIRTIFDAISYEKGASVLQMLHTYIGADNFRDGLRLYLKEHAYGNTETVDLWRALGQIAHKPVEKFMHAWTSQAGFPLVRAVVEDHGLDLSQERFYLNPAAKKDTQATWPIPLHASLKLSADTLKTASETLRMPADHHQLVLNQNRSGFYQVLYNPTHLYKLGEAVKAGRLSQLDRLMLLGDAFESAKAGYLNTVEALKLLSSYAREDSVVVWDIISANLGGLRKVLGDDKLREAMMPFLRDIATEQLGRLGWDSKKNESHFDTLLRPTILALASIGEEPSVVAEAKKRFADMKSPEDIEPDLRGVVYGTVARTGDKAEFDKLLKLHNSSTSSEERVTLTAALTGFKQKALIKRALSMIDGKDVRLQDAGYWLAYSFGNRHAKELTWDWMTSNWQWLEENLGKDLSFYRMPNYAARAFSDETFIPTFLEFFGPMQKQPAFERPVKQAVETIQWQSAWKSRDYKLVLNFFENATK
jgi:aminopeptidase N